MNLDKAKKYIRNNVGQTYLFKFIGARNQTDEFVGKIIRTYNSVFIIQVCDDSNRIKSFSYNDVITNNLKMKEIVMKK